MHYCSINAWIHLEPNTNRNGPVTCMGEFEDEWNCRAGIHLSDENRFIWNSACRPEIKKLCTPQMFLTCSVWCIKMILTLWFHFSSIDFACRMLHLVLIFAPKWDCSWRSSFCIGNTVVIRRQYPPNISNRRYQFPFQICSYDCL